MRYATLQLAAGVLAVISMWELPAATVQPLLKRIALPQVWARTELYFGSQKPGGEVTEDEFVSFMNREINPRFPQGLTLLSAHGHYRDASGAIQSERSNVLILMYPLGARDMNRRIQEIREKYKEQFKQESVMRVDSFTFLSF